VLIQIVAVNRAALRGAITVLEWAKIVAMISRTMVTVMPACMLLEMATFLHYNGFARMAVLGIVESFILQGDMAIWRLPIGRLQMVVLMDVEDGLEFVCFDWL
jgi:hypothetical protein